MRATFVWHAERGRETVRALAAMLEALVRIDSDQLAAGRFPALYAGTVRYESEIRKPTTRGPLAREICTEDWRDARTVFHTGKGDCEDLAALRCAEIRATGGTAIALPFYVRPGLVHCVVWTPTGVEDPSELLGMPTLGVDFGAQIAQAMGWIR